jgi:hypothetical protein
MDRRPEPRTRSRQTKLRRGPGSPFCLVEQGYGVCGARDERAHAAQQQQLVDQLSHDVLPRSGSGKTTTGSRNFGSATACAPLGFIALMRGDHGRAYARPHLVLFTALRMSAKPIAASSCRMLAPPQRDRLLNSRQNPFIQTRSRADWAIPSRRPRSGSRPFSTARIRLIRGVLGYVFSILRDCRRSSRRRRRSFTASLFGHCGSPYFRTWPRPPRWGFFCVSGTFQAETYMAY